jgi:hypothetical protein
MKTTKTYDPKCYDLAEYFLQSEPVRTDVKAYKKYCDELAKHIQQAVEDWFVQP